MPCCAISSCKNASRTKTMSNAGISYHRFPKDPNVKKKWMDVTGRENWFPMLSSTICSEHFLDNDFWISPKGKRFIRENAVPTQKIVLSIETAKPQDPGPSTKRQCAGTADERQDSKRARIDCTQIFNFGSVGNTQSPCSSTYSSPRKQKLKKTLKKTQEKLKCHETKIKRLQVQNRRLKKKIKTLEDILIALQDKYSFTNENITCLENTNFEVKDLIMRQACNAESSGISTKQYSPALRSFALTLHFYSPRAYEYVRSTFSCSLPHPLTLKKWYSHVGGEPGFTEESFAALKMKADSASQPILATLVVDEMGIRRRVEWDGQKLQGYVDMGTGLEGDHLGEAKEALIFLVTSINANFKVPVGYFLVDGVTGQQRAELVKQCLEMCHEAGIKIVALTFDGCAANVSMAANLGCCFQNNDIKFEHPVTKDNIVAVLDPCHILFFMPKGLVVIRNSKPHTTF